MAQTPTDPTKAQVWITKGIDDLDFEFYFPNGPKGDPGGFTTGTALGNANLNEILTPGLYRQDTGSYATQLNNYPQLNGGVLTVTQMAGTGYVVQTYEPLNGSVTSGSSVMYKRSFATPNWSRWQAYVSNRIDQTAGRAIYQWDPINNREQLIYGDTGTRDIAAAGIIASPWTVGSLTIRRVGQMVMYSAYNIQQNGATNMVLLNSLPSGFRPSDYIRFVARQHNANPAFYAFEAGNGNGAVQAYQSGITGAHFTISWMTLDPWPTTLPGVALGTIPNI
ncbi:hypothetical protein SEA_TOKKI_24 [Arthrobacter phage Tokki]|nr:hypothetical protein SEA_TOKKI_24 [Arthrobacter phage Tokki]